MRIDQAGRYFAVAKELPYRYEVDPLLNESSREAVTKKVKVEIDPSPFPDLADRPPE